MSKAEPRKSRTLGAEPRKPHIRHLDIAGKDMRTAVWKGDGAGTPVLFFNGIGANLELIHPLAEALHDRDVIAFDAPGVGGSKPVRVPYRPWQLARMAARILDTLGYGTIDVMGVSWGGAMAQQFAFQYRNRARKLVLVATSAGMVMLPGNPSALLKMWHPRRYVDGAYLMKHFETLYGDEPGGAAEHMVRMVPPSTRGYFYQMLAGLGWTSVPFLPLIRQETLVLAGDRDRIVPLINAKLLARLIPNARLHVVKGGGHLFIVTRAKEIMPVLRGFLDGPAEPALKPRAAAA